MKTTQRNCLYCTKPFTARLIDITRNLAKFCSISCSSKYSAKNKPNPKPNIICSWCKKSFYRSNSKQRNSRSGLFFCNRTCKDNAQRIIGGIKEIHPSHYTDKGTDYRFIALTNLPHKCNRCFYNKYIEVLQVHHINRNRDDNSISNLELICPTCHMEEHFIKKDGLYHSMSKLISKTI